MNNDDNEHIPDPGKQKQCSYCGKIKPLTEFYSRGKKSKLLAAYCKECHVKPFKDERILCPHCKNKIYFIGVDAQGSIMKTKGNLVKRMKMELKRKNRKKKEATQPKPLKDIFK